jgi:choloylglycine hydrolase
MHDKMEKHRMTTHKASSPKRFAAVLLVATMTFAPMVSQACTSFLLPGNDGGFVYGRTLEFGLDIKSKGISIPRGYIYQGTGIDGKQGSGLVWKTKYAAFGANGIDLPLLVDGMNEKGLAGGLLFAPNITLYQDVKASESAQSIASYEMLTYALTNFATVEEVKKGFKEVKVNRSEQALFKGVVTLHMTLHDTSGKSIVIEYINGQLEVSDNPVGVLTNAPKFSWHLTQLNNFTNLSAKNPAPIKMGDMTFEAQSSSAGMVGLPGDMTSVSRFVRAFFMVANVPKDMTTTQQVGTAFHFLNNFDIPPGMIELGGNYGGGTSGYEITYWSSVSDLKNKVFYIRTFQNTNVQSISMSNLDLNAKDIQYFDLHADKLVVKELTKQ